MAETKVGAGGAMNVLMNAVLLCVLRLVLEFAGLLPNNPAAAQQANKHTREPPGHGDSGTGNEAERQRYSGYHNPIALYRPGTESVRMNSSKPVGSASSRKRASGDGMVIVL